jgi:Kef-type K+ transport system membrane component KefB
MPDTLIWLLQLLVVVGAAHGAGWIAARLGQPRVIGEMAAGLLLGPSLLGRLVPGIGATLFGPQSLDALRALSQLGLLLFIFLVGLELQPQQLRQRRSVVLVLTLSSTLVPFVLGVGVGALLVPLVGSPQAQPSHVALFLGVALSITAFPVLARILDERGLLQNPVGALVIVCAAAAMVTTCMTGPLLDLLRLTPQPATAHDDPPLATGTATPDHAAS